MFAHNHNKNILLDILLEQHVYDYEKRIIIYWYYITI